MKIMMLIVALFAGSRRNVTVENPGGKQSFFPLTCCVQKSLHSCPSGALDNIWEIHRIQSDGIA